MLFVVTNEGSEISMEQLSHPLALVPGLLTFSARGVFLTTQLLSIGIGIMRLVQIGMLVLALLSLLIDLIATLATYFLLVDRKARMLQENEKMPIKK